MKLSRLVAATLLAPFAFAQAPANPDWDAAGAAWWAHVQYLASDERQGRLPGTPGFEEATKYVEGQFQAIGLKPGAGSSFRQPVLLDSLRLDPEKSTVEVEANGTRTPLKPGEITLSPHVTAPGTPVDAPLVFIGYGLRLPSKHMDDYAGLDLHGKVAVFYGGSPDRLQGPLRSYSHMPGQRWKYLKAAGAVGMITVAAPRLQAGPAPEPAATLAVPRRGNRPAPATADPATPGAVLTPAPAARPAGRPTMMIADPSLDTLAGMRLNMTISAS